MFAFGTGELLLASMTCPLISPVVGFGVGVQVGTGVWLGATVDLWVGDGGATVLQASVTATNVTAARVHCQRVRCFLASDFMRIFLSPSV
jgi:hypothetical protein